VIAANKMDTAAAQENYADVVSDPDYDHLTVVPASAHAEKALKRGAAADVVDYHAGEAGFTVEGDVSDEQRVGLERIREFVREYEGTGVQTALETALFDELGTVAVFPGSANGRGTRRVSSATASSSPRVRRPRSSPPTSTPTSVTASCTASTAARGDRSAATTNSTTVTSSNSSRRTDGPPRRSRS
jgi:hypothetical protein